jgi:glycosyltransferase involved in cell wall biosynthesis
MNSCKRLSICYIVPGHHLLSSAGPTRNVLYLAESLGQYANVTVAFRSIQEHTVPKGYDIVEIQPRYGQLSYIEDDAAVRGMGFREFINYISALKQFVKERMLSYDIVLEKSWILSGYISTLCQRRGLPSIVIENVMRVWNEPLRVPRDVMRYLTFQLAQTLIGRYLRQSPLVIAETEELKRTIIQRWTLAPKQVEVVGLGVDHSKFRPLDQENARQQLGIAPSITMLLYVGVLDQTHSLTPLIEALNEISSQSIEIHIVGDGVLKDQYQARISGSRKNIVFHGRIPHSVVPQFIAAADLCIAPYDLRMFPNGDVAYSTLKIPEYMACARPVVSVPSGHILNLIRDNITGFLFHNNVENWISFLCQCPSRQELKKMGLAAADMVISHNWESTACAYLTYCEEVISKKLQNRSYICKA